MDDATEYDPRYLAGILFFNRHDFFEAHEVWEDLWQDCAQDMRRFYQGLIQAAVALYHWNNGNGRGARRLFLSGRKHMSTYPEKYLGLDGPRFWQEMECALGDILGDDSTHHGLHLDAKKIPVIELVPAPPSWPDPERILAG